MSYPSFGNDASQFPPAPEPPVMPFWPITLGQLFTGMFAAVRANARTMFMIAMVSSGVVGVLSGLVSAASSAYMFSSESWDVDPAVLMDGGQLIVSNLADFLVSLISALVMLLVSGMLTLSVVNSVVGKNLDISGTWRLLRPNFWKLVGTTVLVWLTLSVGGALLIGAVVAASVIPMVTLDTAVWPWVLMLILGIIVVVLVLVWVGIRLYFVTQVVVAEGAGPFSAMRRSWELTRDAFWRVLGRSLLLGLIVGTVVSIAIVIVTVPFALVAAFGDFPGGVSVFLITLVAMLISGVTLPYTSSYGALMYVDERIRKENLAPALAQALEINQMS